MRPTTTQHLRFLEHSLTPHNVLYWNAWHGVPGWVRSYPYDVVVLHYSVLCMRWEEPFERWRSSLDWIADSDAVRIAMPQDEYVCAATLDEWLGDLDVQCVFSVLDGRHWPVLYPGESQRTRMERTYTGFVDDRAAGAVRAPPRPPRRARRGHRLPRPQPAVPRRPPRAAQARDRADRRAGGARHRTAHGHLDGLQGHEVRRRVVRVPCQRPLRDRHRERLERARPRRRHSPLRGRVEALAPGRHLRGVLGAAGAGLGRLRLHGHQSAPVRGRADQDRAAPRRGSLRRDPRARDALLPAARGLLEPGRGAGAHPRSRARPRPWPSARGRT